MNTSFKKPYIFSVEGNIGSGKSTLVKNLRDRLSNKNFKICFLQEPVDEWSNFKDENGITILEKYYNDQIKYSFQFQMMAYISRLKVIRDALEKDYDIIITERSVLTDRNVFAKMLYDSKKLSKIEYSIYTKWFYEFLKDIPQQNIIYLKTSPTIAYERVLKRARHGEEIPLDYLDTCNEYHEKWLSQIDKHEIDGDIDIFKNIDYLHQCISDVGNFIIKTIKKNTHKNDVLSDFSEKFSRSYCL